jgi:hypothetical protein
MEMIFPNFATSERAQNSKSMDTADQVMHKDQDTFTTGFIGGASEVQWLRSIAATKAMQADKRARATAPHWRDSIVGSDQQPSPLSFWMDEENVDVDFFIDLYELPPLETAERLLSCYIAKVHESFPILSHKALEHQIQEYYRRVEAGNPPHIDTKWLAILNLVFAIGAKYSHLIEASWRGEEKDHLVYQNRARALCPDDFFVTSICDLSQVRILGLLAFYWLSVGQISRYGPNFPFSSSLQIDL